MTEMPKYVSGVPCWVDTLQADPEAAIAFYGKLFDWAFMGPGPMPNGEKYFVARLRGCDVAGVASLPPDVAQPCWSTYVLVDEIDSACARVRQAGGTVLVSPTKVLPAGVFAVVRDPTGGVIGLWHPESRIGAQIVNEPGTWAMNVLTTDDTESAAAFYKALFGWTVEPFGEGGGMFLFRLPTYVGGRAQQPVPRDVVAVMSQSRGDASNSGAHWSVDFRVSVVERTAELATKLDGKVVIAPFDTGFSRNAVLRDPAGAVFSIHSV